MATGIRLISIIDFTRLIRPACLGAIVVFFMSACATLHLSELELPLDSVYIAILADQEQLVPQPSIGSAGTAILFGSLANAVVQGHQNTQSDLVIAPLRERLREIDLGYLWASRLVEADVLRLLSDSPRVHLYRAAPEGNSAMSEDSWFVVRPRIRMTHDMRMLLVSLELAYFSAAPGYRLGRRTHFHNLYQFGWPVVESDFYRLDRAGAIEVWNSWSDEELLQLIETGVATTLRMLEANFLDPRPQTQSGRFDSAPTQLFYGARIWHVDEETVWLTTRQAHFANFYAFPRNSLRRTN